jgi:hypothetical protein
VTIFINPIIVSGVYKRLPRDNALETIWANKNYLTNLPTNISSSTAKIRKKFICIYLEDKHTMLHKCVLMRSLFQSYQDGTMPFCLLYFFPPSRTRLKNTRCSMEERNTSQGQNPDIVNISKNFFYWREIVNAPDKPDGRTHHFHAVLLINSQVWNPIQEGLDSLPVTHLKCFLNSLNKI